MTVGDPCRQGGGSQVIRVLDDDRRRPVLAEHTEVDAAGAHDGRVRGGRADGRRGDGGEHRPAGNARQVDLDHRRQLGRGHRRTG